MAPRKSLQGLAIGLVGAALAGGLWLVGALDWLERPLWDARARLDARPGAQTDRVRLILIDQTSLDWFYRELGLAWPWPREVYEPLLAFCRRGGARGVAFDLVFTEDSRIGVDDDAIFGAAIATHGPVVLPVVLSADQGLATNRPDWSVGHWPRSEAGVDAWFGAPVRAALNMPRASFPISELGGQAAMLATVAGDPDADGAIRRLAPARCFDGQPVPTLGLGLWLATETGATLRVSGPSLSAGGREMPLDARGRAILRYRGPTQTHAAVNAAAVFQAEMRWRETGALSGDVTPERFKDAYVLIGVTAPGLSDLKATPMGGHYPGVEVHATFLDNLLAGDFVREAPRAAGWGAALLLALLAGVGMRHATRPWALAVVTLITLGAPALLGVAAYRAGWWLPVAVGLVAAALSLALAVTVNYLVEGRQKRFIKQAFQHYLSREVVEQVVRNPAALKLGGETRELSIFFSDLQGFTSLSEQLSPEALTGLLNDYLTAMTDLILESGGTLDKYEGDAIIAFWNAPLSVPDHARRAVGTALACQRRLHELNAGFAARVGRPLVMRVGLNSGRVVVGNMGSHQRFDYTFLGDAGNLAARLEGINKQFGTRTLISEHTAAKLKQAFPLREVSRVRVVGKRQAITIYEPLADDDWRAHRERYEGFMAGLTCYYEGRFDAALARFEPLAEMDAPARAYRERCRALLARPPAAWDGVWEMTEK